MTQYRALISCSNTIGLGLLEDVVRVAQAGGVVEEGIVPRMTFPFQIQMVLESETVPELASPTVRVFNLETLAEIKAAPPTPVVAEAAKFSLDESGTSTVAQPYTAESLAAMKWEDLQSFAKEQGVTGRDRAKVTKALLAKLD